MALKAATKPGRLDLFKAPNFERLERRVEALSSGRASEAWISRCALKPTLPESERDAGPNPEAAGGWFMRGISRFDGALGKTKRPAKLGGLSPVQMRRLPSILLLVQCGILRHRNVLHPCRASQEVTSKKLSSPQKPQSMNRQAGSSGCGVEAIGHHGDLRMSSSRSCLRRSAHRPSASKGYSSFQHGNFQPLTRFV